MKKLLFLLMTLAGTAYARPGGGHSFSGGHSYSGHSYSGGHYSSGHYHGGHGDPIAMLVVLGLVLVVAVIVQIIKQNRQTTFTSGRVSPLAAVPRICRKCPSPSRSCRATNSTVPMSSTLRA